MWHATGEPGTGGWIKRRVARRSEPLFREIESLNERIREYDERMEKIANELYPESSLLKQVKGVGIQIALTYILTIEDPYRFPRSREVGCFLGLRPGRRNSGESEPQKKISKEEPVSAHHDGARSALHSGAFWGRQ